MAEVQKEDQSLKRLGLPLLPWHASAVAQLRAAWSAQRMPHALLLQGPEGVGKRSLATWIASAVLCEASATQLDVCGHCPSCTLLAAGSHPDLYRVEPGEGKQQISVDQVREASERLGRTSYRHGYRAVIVEPAHQMTTGAANSLLKTLEEPGPSSLLVLVSSRPSSLPATIRSRCQKLAVRRPTPPEALAWLEAQSGTVPDAQLLQFAGGAPLRAVEYGGGRFQALDEQMQRSLADLLSGASDVTQVARDWADESLNDRLTWLDLWLTSMARQAVAGSDDLVTFPARSAHLPSLPPTLNISGLFGMVDRVRALKAQLVRTALQRELAIESLLMALQACLAPPRGAASEAQ